MPVGLEQWLWGMAAALVVGLAKTGAPGVGILAVAMLAEIFPARQAVGALLPLLIMGDLFAVAYYRHTAEWARLWELFPCVILGIVGGFGYLYLVNDIQLKPTLGALILGLTLLELLRQRMGWQEFPHRRWFTASMGTLAGFATTVGNVAGPIMNIYLISKGLDKLRFMGTAAWYFFIFNCVKIPLYFALGMITSETLLFDLACLPAVAAGALVGRSLLRHISMGLFRNLVLALAVLAALRMLLS